MEPVPWIMLAIPTVWGIHMLFERNGWRREARKLQDRVHQLINELHEEEQRFELNRKFQNMIWSEIHRDASKKWQELQDNKLQHQGDGSGGAPEGPGSSSGLRQGEEVGSQAAA